MPNYAIPVGYLWQLDRSARNARPEHFPLAGQDSLPLHHRPSGLGLYWQYQPLMPLHYSNKKGAEAPLRLIGNGD
jgi:hypothetical protein